MYETLCFGIGLMSMFYFNLVSSKGNVGLYEETDRLTILNDTSYKQIMDKGLETNWFIEYYNSYCGHCVNFAPTFKKFAADVYDWRDTVRVGVLDCRLYGGVCRKIVQYYPTLMFYRAGSNSSMGQELKNLRNVYDLKRGLLKSLNFENFLQPRTGDMTSLGDGAIVIADTDGMLAQEIILDLRPYKKPLYWAKGEFVDGRISALTNPRKTTVALLVMKKGRLEVFESRILSRTSARRAIEAAWGNTIRSPVEEPAAKPETKESVESMETKFRLQMVNKFPHFEDIHSSIVIAFRQDVPLHDVIDGHKLDALKNMLSVIREYLSFMSSYAKSSYRTTFNIIATMYSILENQVKNLSQISGNEWKEKFDAAVLLPKTEDWDCCAGSKAFYRGYPCGLWTMFHSLTVMDCMKQPTATGDRARFVIRSVKDFVINFFSCKECATNFALETKNLEEDVNSPCDAVIWLWRIHNNVNKRLAGKPSEDPKFPKVQFPPPQLCASCARRTKGSEWKEEEVERFLKIFFHPSNLRMKRNSKINKFVASFSLDKELEEIKRHREGRGALNKAVVSRFPHRFNGGNRQSTDLVLCALISLMTTGVAFYIFLMFYRNRYRYRHSSQSKLLKRIP